MHKVAFTVSIIKRNEENLRTCTFKIMTDVHYGIIKIPTL